ncbi:MAG: phage tail tape measure protein [Rhodocyclaceae bacterium]|nr:phage tail tape measure protein [Rhodocyclaceae bacterium]
MSPSAQLAILLTLKDMASGPLSRFGQIMQQTSTQLIAMGEASRIVGGQMMDMMRGPIAAFAEAEDAATRLKTAMMDGTGQVAAEFGAINKLATELGNRLPGTTKDFQNMMTVLVDQGMSYQAILGGLGEAAAYLAVGLKMPFDEASRFAARLSKATGVAEADMLAFLDVISRTTALGISAGEMEYAFGRSAGKLKELGLQGLQASRDLAPLYAILINAGLSGETVGTGFASILSSIQAFAYGLNKNAQEAREKLAQLGVSMNFLDERGQARGVEAIVAELEKLKALAPEVRAAVIRDIFGTGQDAQMVATLIDGGTEAYKRMAAQLANKAALNEKVNAQLGTLKNLWDAATGTLENAAADFAGALAPEIKAATEWLNKAGEALQGLVQDYPWLAKLAGGVLLFGGALAVAGGTVAMIAGVAIKAAGGLALMAKWLGINKALSAGGWARRLASEIANSGAPLKAMAWHLRTLAASAMTSAAAIGGKLALALRMAGQAVLWLGRMVLLNPIGLALAAAALLIYKFWGPISGFFKGLWSGLKAGLAPIGDAFKAAFAPVAPLLRPIGDRLARVFGWFKDLLKPIEDTGGAAERFGARFGQAIAGVVRLFLSLPGKLLALPAEMLRLGGEIVAGLINGIKQKLAAAGEAIQSVGAAVRDSLKNLLGIRSPSRVFAEMGGNLSEGLALGVTKKLGAVTRAAAGMAAAASVSLAGAAVPALHATKPGAGGMAGGAMQITFAPVIHVAGGQPAEVREAVDASVRLSFEEFDRLMRRYLHERGRIAA